MEAEDHLFIKYLCLYNFTFHPPLGPPSTPALVTFSPFTECIMHSCLMSKMGKNFSIPSFGEHLLVSQDTIHMFSHLRKFF